MLRILEINGIQIPTHGVSQFEWKNSTDYVMFSGSNLNFINKIKENYFLEKVLYQKLQLDYTGVMKLFSSSFWKVNHKQSSNYDKGRIVRLAVVPPIKVGLGTCFVPTISIHIRNVVHDNCDFNRYIDTDKFVGNRKIIYFNSDLEFDDMLFKVYKGGIY